ncbi:hypothetical protein ED733_007046 [Metarhizium rileyi]|uniref:Autophagy-related protein 28 n=1 Tax=Metarhizium rileyi (strain RCEF 4871) TaxID=1649241 RepID=A0A5C6GJD7_METRR|nr:hypothetical protein ED733_007046 [Metarhizium rileyi]
MSVTSSTSQTSTNYQLETLEPRPSSSWRHEHDNVSVREHGSPTPVSRTKRMPKHSASQRDDSVGSYSKQKPRAMFAGPPPPVAFSTLTSSRQLSAASYTQEQDQEPYGLVRSMGRSIAHAMFNQKSNRDKPYNLRPNIAWRALRYRQRALEADIQQLLDSQVAGLIFESQDEDVLFARRDFDVHSDAGSSTPTGNFYSTAISRSRMPRSLYTLPASTPEGNIIPVRQPANNRLLGLKSARNGLFKAMRSLVELREEETEQVDMAIAQRKYALAQLNKLDARRLGLQTELSAVDDDKEEPLGKQLQELEATFESLDHEVNMLEEKLMSLRNQRRWLKEKMDDVKGKREAGLSGYRGALKDIESELALLIRRPAFLPLEPAEFAKDGGALDQDIALSGGSEYLNLIPERRTPDMARSWWEAELDILERRGTQVDEERQALERGAAVWNHVVALVSGFESELRCVLKGNAISTAQTYAKSTENAVSEKDLIQAQLRSMDTVLRELEKAMSQAETHGWNLLICAIGAELETFKEAHIVLSSILSSSDALLDDTALTVPTIRKDFQAVDQHRNTHEDSDNDIPPDLLMSRFEETDQSDNKQQYEYRPMTLDTTGERPRSRDTENDVPLEFLAEHD